METRFAREIEGLEQDGQSRVPPETPRLTLLVREVTKTANPASKPAARVWLFDTADCIVVSLLPVQVWTQATPSSHAFREGDVCEVRDRPDLEASRDCFDVACWKALLFRQDLVGGPAVCQSLCSLRPKNTSVTLCRSRGRRSLRHRGVCRAWRSFQSTRVHRRRDRDARHLRAVPFSYRSIHLTHCHISRPIRSGPLQL